MQKKFGSGPSFCHLFNKGGQFNVPCREPLALVGAQGDVHLEGGWEGRRRSRRSRKKRRRRSRRRREEEEEEEFHHVKAGSRSGVGNLHRYMFLAI